MILASQKKCSLQRGFLIPMYTPETISTCNKFDVRDSVIIRAALRMRLGIAPAGKSTCFIAAHVESFD